MSVSEGTLFYRAAAGEANALTVVFSHDPGPEPEGQASITDAGAPLTAGPGCQTLGPSTAMCVLPPGPQPPVEINLRGRADSLVLSGTLITNFLNVGAGAGDDRVSLEALVFFDREFSGASVYGSDGNDVVNGGPDDTLIDPGRGDDVVRGGAGNDYIYADAGDDRIKGGPGPHDRYAPQLAPGPVVINLTTGIARGNGNDRLSGIEDLNGSSGNDSLTGDANRNHIYGDFGNDRVSGGGGDDFLLGAQGRDLIFGENGDDRLYGHDTRDRLFGGEAAMQSRGLTAGTCWWVGQGRIVSSAGRRMTGCSPETGTEIRSRGDVDETARASIDAIASLASKRSVVEASAAFWRDVAPVAKSLDAPI